MAVIDAIDKLLREELSPGIRESLPDTDPVFGEIRSTSMGVERDGLGRDWKFIETFETGLSGAYAIRSAAGGPVVSGLVNTTMFGPARSFPSYEEATATGFLQKIITLKEGFGTIAIPHQYLRADRLTASIGSAVKAILKGTAKNITHNHAVHFYMDDTTNRALVNDVGTVATTTSNNGTSAVTLELETQAGGADGVINRLFPGLLVDCYTSGDVLINSGFMVVVDQVDYLDETVVLKSVDGSNLTLTNNGYITFKDSATIGFSGLNDWIAESGTIFNIALADYPHFKSLIESVTGSLSEQTLNAHNAKFARAYGGKMFLDTVITTPGVTVGYINDLDGDVNRFARQGQALTVSAGWDTFDYTFNGRKTKWMMSSYCGKGDLYQIKTGDRNINRYVPPALADSTSDPNFDGSVEFINTLGGAKGISMVGRSAAGAPVDGQECPFVLLQEFCARMPQSIKLTGITETYDDA